MQSTRSASGLHSTLGRGYGKPAAGPAYVVKEGLPANELLGRVARRKEGEGSRGRGATGRRPREEMVMHLHVPADGAPRPCLILAHNDPLYAVEAYRYLHRLGWDVRLASSGPEARRLAREVSPSLVVLDAYLNDESGWLTCEKLTGELPGVKVILVAARPSSSEFRFAYFCGASALVDREDGLQALVEETSGTSLPAAG